MNDKTCKGACSPCSRKLECSAICTSGNCWDCDRTARRSIGNPKNSASRNKRDSKKPCGFDFGPSIESHFCPRSINCDACNNTKCSHYQSLGHNYFGTKEFDFRDAEDIRDPSISDSFEYYDDQINGNFETDDSSEIADR